MNLLFALLAVLAFAGAIWSFLSYQQSGQTMMFVITIICILATLGFGGVFLAKKLSNKEEIHITE